MLGRGSRFVRIVAQRSRSTRVGVGMVRQVVVAGSSGWSGFVHPVQESAWNTQIRTFSDGGTCPPPQPVVFKVNEQTFQAKVVQKCMTTPVILMGETQTCGYCKKLLPIIEQAVRDQKGKVLLARFDAGESPQLAQSLQIDRFPAVLAVYQGRSVGQFLGYQSKEFVEKFVQEVITKSSAAGAKPGQEDGKTPVNEIDEAERLMGQVKEILAKNPAQDSYPEQQMIETLKMMTAMEAPEDADKKMKTRFQGLQANAFACLARLALKNNAVEEAKELIKLLETNFKALSQQDAFISSTISAFQLQEKLADIPEDARSGLKSKPEDQLSPEERLQLAEVLVAEGQNEQAINHGLHLLKSNPKDEKAQAFLLDLFKTLGPTHELTKYGRRKLASYLMR